MKIEPITEAPFDIPRIDSPDAVYESLDAIRTRFKDSSDYILVAVGDVDWPTTTIKTAVVLYHGNCKDVYEKENEYEHLMTMIMFPEKRPWLDIRYNR